MTTLMTASHQWASRPDDERFTSLIDLHAFANATRENSRARVVASRTIQAQPDGDDMAGLIVAGASDQPVAPTNWAFNQLAQRAGAPAAYLRSLASPLAADCINYGLQINRTIEDVGLLTYQNGGGPELRAVTGPNYGRIWNADVAGALVKRFGDGVSGDWRVPGEFGKAVTVDKSNTTIYASDRDMFVFLADEKNRIDLPNRRDGKTGQLARGFFVWNSEVGNTSLGIAFFLFDYVCCNRIVWGAQEYKEVAIRHTAGAPLRWVDELMPALQHYSTSASSPVVALLESAQKKKVDDVQAFLAKRFTVRQAQAMVTVHQAEEGRPIETVWDAVTAATAYARGINNQDSRVEIERTAGGLLELAR